jgi:hypothetical protein
MAGSITTALTNSSLAEYLSAGHCFLPPSAGVACTCSSTTAMVLTSAQTGIAVGMAVTGTNAASNTFVAGLSPSSDTAVTLSIASTGALTSATFTADVFKMALIASALAGNIAYGTLTTNAGVPGTGTPAQTNLGTDEQAASGTYAAGGIALTNASLVQTNPVNSAAIGFTTTIQWTGATLSVAGSMLYNTTPRLSSTTSSGPPVNNRVNAIYSFGGTQTVTSGTMTLTQPTQDGHTGLVRLSPN